MSRQIICTIRYKQKQKNVASTWSACFQTRCINYRFFNVFFQLLHHTVITQADGIAILNKTLTQNDARTKKVTGEFLLNKYLSI